MESSCTSERRASLTRQATDSLIATYVAWNHNCGIFLLRGPNLRVSQSIVDMEGQRHFNEVFSCKTPKSRCPHICYVGLTPFYLTALHCCWISLPSTSEPLGPFFACHQCWFWPSEIEPKRLLQNQGKLHAFLLTVAYMCNNAKFSATMQKSIATSSPEIGHYDKISINMVHHV